MNPKRMLTVVTLAGLSLGGLTATSAVAAQGYGGSQAGEAAVETVEVAPSGIELVQTEGETEAESTEERSGRSGHKGGCNLEAAAEAIGIEEAELKEAIDGGDTIADVAEANGVSVDVVIDAMVDAKAERIAEKVESGRITQEQADEKLAELETKTTNRVNGVDGDSQA